jgi:hypothetical protein
MQTIRGIPRALAVAFHVQSVKAVTGCAANCGCLPAALSLIAVGDKSRIEECLKPYRPVVK